MRNLFVLLLTILLIPVASAADLPNIKQTDLQLLSSKRVGRSIIEYEYIVSQFNSGATAINVAGVVVSNDDSTKVTLGEFKIGSINENVSKLSETSIKLQIDRAFPFDPNNLEFYYSGDLAQEFFDLTSISDGEITDKPAIFLEGKVSHPFDNLLIVANNFPGKITEDGAFSIGPIILTAGQNDIEIKLIERTSSTILQSKTLTVSHIATGTIQESVGPSGGTIQVKDYSNPLFGTAIFIPENAVAVDTVFSISQDLDHLPILPFEYEAVSKPATFSPLAYTFNSAIQIEIPVDRNKVGPDTALKALFYGDNGWEEIEATKISDDRVRLQVSNFNFAMILIAKLKELSDGQLLLKSNPAYASIYINDINTGKRTPAIIESGSEERNLKLFLPGYNEIFTSLSESEHSQIEFILSRPSGDVPEIILDNPLQKEFKTTEADLALTGILRFRDQPLSENKIVFSLNGRDYIEQTNAQGFFNGAVVLSRGANKLSMRATGPNGQTYFSDTYTITLGSPDLTATLSWNTESTDIDLHVFSPTNQHASYQNKSAIAGGSIDRDDRDGYGPEIFTLENAPHGTYRFNVDAYRISGTPTIARLEIRVGNYIVFNDNYRFTSDDQNAGRGVSGNANAFWLAASVNIDELLISSLSFPEVSTPENAIFTTADSENLITVNIDAPETINDSQISIAVTETNDNSEFDTSNHTGRRIQWQAEHALPADLTEPSNPITYEIKAIVEDLDLESAPVEVVQEERSQIRQEYIDKRESNASFARPTPDRADLIASNNYNPPAGYTYFTFQDFAQWNDFGPGLAIIGESDDIAHNMRVAWGHPLRVTSGYRNPRRNDRQGAASFNSFHQTGDAVDLNPTFGNNWPAEIVCDENNPEFTTIEVRSYALAQQALTCLARNTFNDDYDILFHANHLHIELDP